MRSIIVHNSLKIVNISMSVGIQHVCCVF